MAAKHYDVYWSSVSKSRKGVKSVPLGAATAFHHQNGLSSEKGAHGSAGLSKTVEGGR